MKSIKISTPFTGNVVQLEAVDDPVFSHKLMGDGFGIIPTDGRCVAPISGIVTAIFPTGHAVGITADNGVEVLVHVGLDTVELNGVGFEKMVNQGQQVRKGELMVFADLAYIEKQGYSTQTAVIITNQGIYRKIELSRTGSVKFGEEVLVLCP